MATEVANVVDEMLLQQSFSDCRHTDSVRVQQNAISGLIETWQFSDCQCDCVSVQWVMDRDVTACAKFQPDACLWLGLTTSHEICKLEKNTQCVFTTQLKIVIPGNNKYLLACNESWKMIRRGVTTWSEWIGLIGYGQVVVDESI